MTDVQQIRRDILSYIRDHHGTSKWDVLLEVCPDCQKTGFRVLKDLMDEDMVRTDCVHTAIGDGSRVVTFTLYLSPKGRESLEVAE